MIAYGKKRRTYERLTPVRFHYGTCDGCGHMSHLLYYDPLLGTKICEKCKVKLVETA